MRILSGLRDLSRSLVSLFLFFGLSAGLTSFAQSIDYERIDQRATRLMERDDMMGLAIGIVENG